MELNGRCPNNCQDLLDTGQMIKDTDGEYVCPECGTKLQLYLGDY